jgi:hypothetical protein
MALSTSSYLRILPIALVVVAGTSIWSTAACAQETQAPLTSQPLEISDTIRLTDAQRMAILDGNTMESAAAARGELPGSEDARRGIHGEVGAMIGSNGSHAVYGAASIPLGDHGEATVAFESSSFRYRR